MKGAWGGVERGLEGNCGGEKDGGTWSGRAAKGHSGGQPRGLVSDCCGGLCRVAAGTSERWRAVSNGRCAVVRSGLQRRAGGCGPGMFPDGGSPVLRGWGGLREKEARNEGAGRNGRFGRNSRNNRRGCSFAGPGRGVSGRQLSEDVSGWQRSGAPGLLCGCPLRNAERVSGAVVPFLRRALGGCPEPVRAGAAGTGRLRNR